MPDAAFYCPAAGSQTAPIFEPTVTTISTTCDHYVISRDSDTAMTECAGVGTKTLVEQATIEGALADAMLPAPAITTADLQQPRIVPEGDEVFVRRYDTANPQLFFFDDYTRAGGGPWSFIADVTFPITGAQKQDEISVPSRGATRRVIYTSYGATTSSLTELEGSGGTWQAVTGGVYTASQLQMNVVRHANLTADGLHLLVTGVSMQGASGLFIADRRDTTMSFGTPVQITSIIGNVTDAYLTEDCGVLYYAVGNTYGVFRAHQ